MFLFIYVFILFILGGENCLIMNKKRNLIQIRRLSWNLTG